MKTRNDARGGPQAGPSNGGTSLKDDARTAAEEAVRAREMAERVASELAVLRRHQAEGTALTTQSVARIAYDVTNVRAGQ